MTQTTCWMNSSSLSTTYFLVFIFVTHIFFLYAFHVHDGSNSQHRSCIKWNLSSTFQSCDMKGLWNIWYELERAYDCTKWFHKKRIGLISIIRKGVNRSCVKRQFWRVWYKHLLFKSMQFIQWGLFN